MDRTSAEPEAKAADVIKWIQDHCRIPEGGDVGGRVELRDWQKDLIERIYNNPAGTRRAIISFGRKNAKTTLSAFLLLAHLCGPKAKANSSLYSAAQSRDQAAILFGLAAKIVRMSPTLQSRIVIRETAKQLHFPSMGTTYRALSADASTAYGLSPVFIVHDELGQVRGPRSELYDALETATGAQGGKALSIVISTQAPTDADLLSVLIDAALAGHDPRVVLALYTAPEDDDPFADETIKKANPAFGDFLDANEVRSMAEDARHMPARESAYRNLVLNQRVEASSPFITPPVWKACGFPVLPFDKDTPVYGGLDLSAVADLTAWILIGRINGKWHIRPTFWLPGDGLVAKAKADRVPYDLWRDQSFLLTAPGKSVDYEFVAEWLRADFDKFNIRKIGFDRWGMNHLKPWLIKAGFDEALIEERFVPFGQGTLSMTPALRVLEGAISNQQVAHGNHPILTMCFRNAVVEGKDESVRKLSKQKSSGRIDGAVATAMAFGVAPFETAEIDICSLIG